MGAGSPRGDVQRAVRDTGPVPGEARLRGKGEVAEWALSLFGDNTIARSHLCTSLELLHCTRTSFRANAMSVCP